jgi:hypothetical protein
MIPRHPLAAALALLLGLATAPIAAQVGALALVVEDAVAFPDSQVDVIVRTAAPLPLASGSFTFLVRERDDLPIPLLASVVSVTAYASGGDAVADATLDPATQSTSVTFWSASGTLNTTFGPLVVVRYQLAAGLQDRQRFFFHMTDLALVAPDASPVPSLPGRGRVRIVLPEPGEALAALGGEYFPGDVVVAGAATVRPYAIGSGTIELLFDPAFADGPAVVTIDPRYGSAVIDDVSEPAPGQMLVTFHSPDGDLNAGLHGLWLTVAIPSKADLVPPATFAFAFGPATALADPAHAPIALETDADPVTFLVPEILFAAFFDGGDFFEWPEAAE